MKFIHWIYLNTSLKRVFMLCKQSLRFYIKLDLDLDCGYIWLLYYLTCSST